MNRSVWVDSGNDFDPNTGQQITQPFFDGRDPRLTLKYLRDLKSRGYDPGIYLCSQGEGWPSHNVLTPEAWADWAYDLVQNKIAPKTSGSFPMVDLNCETDAPWVMRMLRRWRAHSPQRYTAYSPQCNKWPLFTNYGAELSRLNVYIRPQCFVGDMRRVESGTEVIGWTRIGVDPLKILPMLDGASLGEWWTGTAFTQGRIP